MKGISNSESKRRVIVCPPTKRSVRKLLRQLKGNDFGWAYLGEDVAKAIAIERQLRDRGQRIEIAEELQEIAQALRQPYIDYIGKLSLENNSISWWVSSLSEKNPWVSKVFLHICYIRLCQTIVKSSGQEPLIFFAENKALREGIVKNVRSYFNLPVPIVESRIDKVCRTLKFTCHLAVNRGYFLVNGVGRLLLARYYGFNRIPEVARRDGKGLVFIHTWLDQRSFNANGEYHDSFFGNLTNHLRNQGKSVAIVPYILGTVPYHQTLKKMARSQETFLVPQAFLGISDIFGALVRTMKAITLKGTCQPFEGIDISGLITDDLKNDWARMTAVASSLFSNVVKHWKTAGIPIDTFIHTYENHKWEKAYNIALRKLYPSTKIIGFQHATVPTMLLNYFFSKDELPVLPFPDKVITTGKYTAELFLKSGYDPAKVVCGGAIRYISLMNREKNTLSKKDTSNLAILVTPSIDKNETVELIWKVLMAFGQTNKYKIIFKFHPSCPYHYIAKDLGTLPQHFAVSDKPIGELLQESRLLIYASSTTCIEALSSGIPILHIKSDYIIDMDVIPDSLSGIRQSAKNKDDIIRMTEKILETDEKELSEQRIIWEDIVTEIFGPVDDGVYDLFLQEG